MAYKREGERLDVGVRVMLDRQLHQAVDDYRQAHQLPTKSYALRELVRYGLQMASQPPAAPGG